MKFDILKPEAVSGVGSAGVDTCFVFPTVDKATIHDKLFVVAEDVGDGGLDTKAAEYHARSFADHMFQNTCSDEPLEESVLEEALLVAKKKIDEECPDSLGVQYAVLYLHRHGVLAAHLGSTRIYHIRPKGRRLMYKSRDNDSKVVPGVHSLDEPVKACITNVQYGDYFVIMTKGACQAISDRELIQVMCEPVNDKTKSVRLMKLAEAGDAGFAFSIIHISGVMNEAMDEGLFENESKLMAAMTADDSPVGRNTIAMGKNVVDDVPHNIDRSKKKESLRRPELEREEELPVTSRDEGGKHEFPIVTVTALALVLLAVGIWFWAQRPKEEKVPEETVKVDKPKEKDTINILKNTRPKSVSIDDPKAQEKKEEEKKKEEAAKPQVEKPAEQIEVEPVEPVNTTNTQASGTTVTSAPESANPVPATPATSPSTTTPSTTTPVNTPASDGTVTPKPVIPEGE